MPAALDAIVTKIRMMLGRAVLTLVDDAKKMQSVQVAGMDRETLDDVEHPQPYGFTSHPLPGAEAFMMFVGGDRSHGIALVIDDRRYRLKPLDGGEVALYTHEGSKIALRNGRLVEIDCDRLSINASDAVNIDTGSFEVKASTSTLESSRVNLTTPRVVASGQIRASGRVSSEGDIVGLQGGSRLSLSDIRSTFNKHIHKIDDKKDISLVPTSGSRL